MSVTRKCGTGSNLDARRASHCRACAVPHCGQALAFGSGGTTGARKAIAVQRRSGYGLHRPAQSTATPRGPGSEFGKSCALQSAQRESGAAFALSERVTTGGLRELDDYLGFLKGGCSQDPLELLRRVAERLGEDLLHALVDDKLAKWRETSKAELAWSSRTGSRPKSG